VRCTVKFSLLATVIWAAGFVLNAALFLVLLYKRRYRSVPWFSGWIGFGCLYTITLFIAYRIGSKQLYAVLYWSGAFIDLLFQIAVVLEIARSVLQRSGRWVEGARVRLILVAAIAPIVGLGMAWFMTPAAETRLDALEARGSLFTTILICLLISSVIAASQHLGLGWKSHIMRESYGLIVWTLVAFITDTLHAYWRTMGHFTALEDVRMVFYQASLIYWAVAFWLPERNQTPMTTGTINRLDRLKGRLEYRQSGRASSTDGVSSE
jgi:hypothetical protein